MLFSRQTSRKEHNFPDNRNRAKRNVGTSEGETFNKHWIHRTFHILNKIQLYNIFIKTTIPNKNSRQFPDKIPKTLKTQDNFQTSLNFQTILPRRTNPV